MIDMSYKWHNNWDKIEELYKKLTDVVEAKKRYDLLYKFDKDYDNLTQYTTVSHNIEGYHQMFAKTANSILENYIRDEES